MIILLNKNQLASAKKFYIDYLVAKIPPYALFSAKKNGTTITGYLSGKVLFQGTNAETEGAALSKFFGLKSSETATTPPLANLSLLGSDEVGNGSYFGPLVVVATFAEEKMLPTLRKLGVKDSKMLKDPEIKEIAQQLMTILPYKTLVVTPKKYNEYQQKFNAVEMKVLFHHHVLTQLAKELPVKPAATLVDAFTTKASLTKYSKTHNLTWPQPFYFVEKGEQQHLAVAAASMIARKLFLDYLEQDGASLGLPLPSGAGAKSDLVAAEILRQGGLDLLGEHAKLHFANTQKAEKLM
ncbi:ribonuclease HIII [Enterococcus timonensis]|uniref:ribonuclease HIII n=1 Tax=Enterococcus timonensis TaxID=1852364 RepID=UPI0008D9FC8C|nr:ribonuclease HIII [Enterococcus timonensis]